MVRCTGHLPSDPPLYEETQRFHQVWILLFVGFITLITWYSFYQQIILGIPFGNNPGSDAVVAILFIVFGILLPVLFLVMRLEIQVTRTALWFRFFPFHLQWREVPSGAIAEAKAVRYRPLLEYGGWGIRLGRRGIAYNVSGDRGVQITLKGGKSFLLGSQRAEEMESLLLMTIQNKV
ncbi:MAG: DUF6141 family protein [Methanomicrobiales archaeon]|nr:DUF6141 family protein [Methanomicrobiales archaeon]